jgi:hypothetical protein
MKETRKEEIIKCACCSPEHIMDLNYDKELNMVFLSIHLKKYNSFWRRLWYAIKYIFGYQCKYGTFDEFIINESNVSRIREILAKVETNESEG